MELRPHDLDQLHIHKIRVGLDESLITQQYFFCIDMRMIYIKKSRGYYKLMASSQCGFESLYRESCLDVIAGSKDLSEIIIKFYNCCYKLLEIVIK